MKRTLAAAALLVLLIAYLRAGPEEAAPAGKDAGERKIQTAADLQTTKDRVSYAIGLQIGRNLKGQMIEVDPQALLKGIQDGTAGGPTLLTDAEMQEAMTIMQAEAGAKRASQADQNLKDGQAYLAKNKTAEGVVTLPSGLQYKILKEGSGQKPEATSTVKTHYRGTLIDGTQFDSSYDRGEPAEFQVRGVIRGWTEALQLMPVGSKWQLFIPSDLAYGERGRPSIPPNSTLVFEVELLEIVK